jgi:hypothetical protein
MANMAASPPRSRPPSTSSGIAADLDVVVAGADDVALVAETGGLVAVPLVVAPDLAADADDFADVDADGFADAALEAELVEVLRDHSCAPVIERLTL